MKLVRYGAPGREKPGIIGEDGKIRDLSRIVKDIDGAMLASGGLAKIKKANLKRMKPVAGKPRLGPCVGNVRNFIAIGLNYADHAAESRHADPEGAGGLLQDDDLDLRPERRHHPAEGLDQARLRGRDRHRHRHAARATWRRTRPRRRSPAISSATTCPSARSRSSAPAASG